MRTAEKVKLTLGQMIKQALVNEFIYKDIMLGVTMPTKTKSNKRANGEGSFYQLENRTWVHQITLGLKPDGKPDRKSFKGRTKTECLERKKAFLDRKNQFEAELLVEKTEREKVEEEVRRRGHSLESEIIFGNAFLPWLNLYKTPPTVKPATYKSYLDIYNVHFMDHFGKMMLCDVTQDFVQEY